MNQGCLHRLGAWSCEPRLFASLFAIQGCWRRLGAGYARQHCFLCLGGLGDANRAYWHTSSMPTLCSPCCHWTCHVIHVNVVLAVLLLDLPCHPRQRCARRVVIGLATSSLGYPHRRWACWLLLGFARVEGREKGLATVVKGNANMTYLTVSHNMGLPLHFHNPLHPPIILHQC